MLTGDHSLSTYAKFSEKLSFLPPDTHISFSEKNCVRTKWMISKVKEIFRMIPSELIFVLVTLRLKEIKTE